VTPVATSKVGYGHRCPSVKKDLHEAIGMWIPNPVYDRAPHYWLFLGLLLIIVGIYLGIEINSMYMYLGVAAGLAACIWALRVFSKRGEKQSPASEGSASGD